MIPGTSISGEITERKIICGDLTGKSVSADLSLKPSVTATLSEVPVVSGQVSTVSVNATIHSATSISAILAAVDKTPPYEGEYTVIPQVGDATILETAGTALKDDIIVTAIPEYRVSNEYGTTLIIGG